MKYGFRKKLISLVLCFSMILPLLTQFGPIQFTAVETETETEQTVNSLEKNIGNQAVFDWWAEFLLVDDATLKYSTAEEMSDYYGNSEVGYGNWLSYDDISANDLILTITDYYYDEENEFHWYRVTGDNLPSVLKEKPWVFYSDQYSLEEASDPYLVIYDKYDTIRIINASVFDTSNVRFVFSGPKALADATITVSDYDGAHTVSDLSFYDERNGAWSAALQVSIKKADGTDWSYLDGTVGILYTAENIAMDTYTEDLWYGGAFLYVNESVYSACVTERFGYDASDIVYTNAASSVVVFEIFDYSFEYFNEAAYLASESAPLYDVQLNAKEHLASEIPAEFVAGYTFVHDGEYYYWLENEGFVGSPYFIAKASDVTLGRLPDEYGDGRVTVTDKNGSAVESVVLPLYKKTEYTAVSSISLTTADVSYQWQIEIDDGVWTNILGENSSTIEISFGMVATLLDRDGVINIRCETKSSRLVAYSAEIPVSIDASASVEPEDADSASSVDNNNAKAFRSRSLAAAYATSGATPLADDKVIVTLTAVTQEGQVILQEPYELEIGGTVSRTVSIPYMQGYDLYDADGNILTPDKDKKFYKYVVLETNVTESYEIILTYKPGKSSFKVVYFLQNALDDGYTQAGDPITVEGITGEDVNPNHEVFAKDFEGFYQLLFSPAKIASDGSTKIEVYYDRLYYKVLFDLDGGFGVQPVYARFGTPVSVDDPSRSGYNFLGWDANKGWIENTITGAVTEWDLDNDSNVDIEQFFEISIPAYHTSYIAKWAIYESANVTVVIWGQDADGPGYSYDAEETFNINAKPGATISYVPGANICGFDAHVHGTDCAAICGKEVHSHSDSCYNPDCGFTEHTVHDDSCWNCGGIQAHSISCYKASKGTLSNSPETDEGALRSLIQLSGANTNGKLYRITRTYYGWDYQFYYFKLGDNFYQVTGFDVGNNTTVTLKTNCGHTNLHEEHNSDCKLTCTVHAHVDGCYALTCGKSEHSHIKDCYSCGIIAHTHSAACKHTTKYDSSNLWYLNTGKTVSVTVSPDGSTTLNVYYDRTEFTLNFFDGNNEVYSINARHGANISHHWPITRADGFVYGEGQRWNPDAYYNNSSTTFSSVLVFIERMPAESFYLKLDEKSTGNGYAKYEMHYMVEALPGETNVVGYNNKSFVEYNVVYAVYNYLTKTEDFFDLKGFSQWESDPDFVGTKLEDDRDPIAYLYYTRNSYDLIFNNYKLDENGDAVDERVVSVQYQEALKEYGSYVLPNSAAPSFYEEGSMTFKGWYMSPQVPYNFDFESAVEFNFDAHSMPSNDLILYAWWEPVSHEVAFYHSIEDLEEGKIYEAGGSKYVYMVPHGSTIQNPYTPPADPSNGKYSFVGWFYKDNLGQEQMWDFANTTVTAPTKIYAKWSSNILMTYTVKFAYVDANGVEVEIADPITGSVLAGNTKTFSAKSGNDLKADYQTRYFPLVQSHSLTIDIEDESKNTYTFYYVYRETVPYTVYYLTKENPNTGLGTMIYNEETYYLIAETYEVTKNEKAIVTENANFIGGYVFDDYQKRLEIDPTEGAKNELYFFYEKDIVNGQFVVHYMTENLDGTFREHSSFTGKQPANSSYAVPNPPKSIANFTFDADNPLNKLEGTIATDSILELWVYYTRNSYNYTVQYLDKATHAVLYEDKNQTWSGKWEAFVTEHAISIDNYTPVAPTEVTIQISASEDENLIIFYYEENKVEINYEAIGGGTVSPEKEEVKVSSGAALGSTATANKGYEFVGWFDNQNGTGTPLSTNSRYIPHKSGSAWVSKTYYAIFREKDVQLNYAVIGPVGSGSVSVTQETVKAVSGIANGSTAILASSAYRFVGWFDNADGSGAPLDTNAAFKPTKESDEIWSDGITYYAKFEYNLTSLIIDKVFPTGVDYSMDVNQSFIFNVSEVDQNGATVANGVNLIVSIHGDGQITVDGLTVGKYYKITERTDWSWRYGVCTPTSALESVVNGNSIILKVTSDHHANKVIFTNVRTNNQWLDGDSWCNNIFK